VLDESRRLADLAFPHAPAAVVVRAVIAWTQLFGMISFELFGHFHSVIEDLGPVVERALLETGHLVGLPAPWGAARARAGASSPDGGHGREERPEGASAEGEDTWFLI
jgi:hypothetical protein